MFPSNRFSFAVQSGAREMSQSTQANELRLGAQSGSPGLMNSGGFQVNLQWCTRCIHGLMDPRLRMTMV